MRNTFFKRISTAVTILLTVLIPSEGVLHSRALSPEALHNIDNTMLTPIYLPDQEVELLNNNGIQTPKWLPSSIIAEVNISKASAEGTFASAIPMLDYYQELGVNCLWVDPINEMGHAFTFPNGYTNYGLDTIEPEITGASSYQDGWRVFSQFVEEAHKRDIRILLDIVIWGVSSDTNYNRSILIGGQQHTLREILQTPDDPTSWSGWGGPKYAYSSPLFIQWYKETLLKIITDCNIDGIRVDLEPLVTGYDLFEDIREQAYSLGHKIVIVSEHANDRRSAFDIEQMGVVNNWTEDLTQTHANAFYFTSGGYNIVDSIQNGTLAGDSNKSGEKKYYTYCYSTHDNTYSREGTSMDLGYNAIFSPYIPIVYMGEATNDRVDLRDTSNPDRNLYYYGYLNLSSLDNYDNRTYYEKIKRYIQIRRTYVDIFESFADNHKNSNIVKVLVSGLDSYQPYARFSNGKAIIVVPNGTDSAKNVSITIPSNIGVGANVSITDLMKNKSISNGVITQFNATVEAKDLGIYLIDDGSVETTGCEIHINNHINDKKYTVTNDMLRVNQDNNPSQYLWPIDFTASPSGVRMQYHLQSSGLSSNISGTPYMQNFSEAIYLDDAHLKFTLNNGSSNEYYDQNFQARKLVIKLANSLYKNVPSNELYFTFSFNNADPYVDVLEVTPANISTQRFYMSQYLDKFGDSVNTYDIVFSVCADGSLILHVNDIPIDIATANLISTTDTDITSPVYLYIAACTDYTDITLNTLHGGDLKCEDKDPYAAYINNALVTDDILRVNLQNNFASYNWPISISNQFDGVRMRYRLQSSGTSANSSGVPYMQSFNSPIQLEEAELKFRINNEPSLSYADANFMARKIILKLSNSNNSNSVLSDLYFTLCINDADPYVDVMHVTAGNMTSQRFSMSEHLSKFGDAIKVYQIKFSISDSGDLILYINDVAVSIATSSIIAATTTDLNAPLYLYIGADYDYTDITLMSFQSEA